MPVPANLNAAAPDVYGITWQDNTICLGPVPGTDPLNLPNRNLMLVPYVIELTPNEHFALMPNGFAIQIRFSQGMNKDSVAAHGRLTISQNSTGDFYDGALAGLSPSWDASQTTLTLTPPAKAGADLYEMELNLSAEVKSLSGPSVRGSPVSTQFAIVQPNGANGGSIASPGVAALTVPAIGSTAASADGALNYEIHATGVFSAPIDLMSPDGLAYLFTPKSAALGAPATATLPVPELREGAAIFRLSNHG